VTDKENISHQIDNLRDEIERKRELSLNVASDCQLVKSKIAEIGEQNSLSETRSAYALSLYNKISGITWDGGEVSGVLMGCKDEINILFNLVIIMIIF
jgi:hypothetical protein